MNNKTMIAAALCLATIVGVGSTAAAGEVTGNGKTTPISVRAGSICAFSGLEDGIALVGFDDDGGPIFEEVEGGPGIVQTPHMDAGMVHAPGIAGQACRGYASRR